MTTKISIVEKARGTQKCVYQRKEIVCVLLPRLKANACQRRIQLSAEVSARRSTQQRWQVYLVLKARDTEEEEIQQTVQL